MDTKPEGNFFEKYGMPVALVIGLGLIAAAVYYGHGTGAPSAANNGQQQAAQAVDIKDVKTDGDPFVGSANAPVTMAFWFDYQCPFCKQFDQTVTSQIYDKYVKTGKVKIVFKDFQFLGDDSMTDAEFGRAMWEAYPDKFYEWYTAMFAAQDDEGDVGFGDLDSVKALTAKIPGVDVNKVTDLVTKNKAKYDAAIMADRNEGATFGINGTPAFIIGTTMQSGAQPPATVEALIDAELAK